jgi:hypothetical protein
MIKFDLDYFFNIFSGTVWENHQMKKNIHCRASKFNVKVFNILYISGDLYMNNMGIYLICVYRNYIWI